MTLPNQRPYIQGNARRQQAEDRREDVAEIHHRNLDSPVSTRANGDESSFGSEHYPGNFTKGLHHDEHGFVTKGYQDFVTETNKAGDPAIASDFSDADPGLPDSSVDGQFFSINNTNSQTPQWRGWESPRAGHYYSLQGPDADAIGMAPAPKLGSDELVAEMAELYAMAMLRDIPFGELSQNHSNWPDSNSGITLKDVLDALNQIPFFQTNYDDSNERAFTKRRRAARQFDPNDYSLQTGNLNSGKAFRVFDGSQLFLGSGPGVKTDSDEFISQFMLLGNKMGILLQPMASLPMVPKKSARNANLSSRISTI